MKNLDMFEIAVLGILADKQDEDLRNKTPEELKAMLTQLD